MTQWQGGADLAHVVTAQSLRSSDSSVAGVEGVVKIRFEVLVGCCCCWCRTMSEEVEPRQTEVTALTNFFPKKSRSGLLSNNKGGSKRGDSTLFGERISVKEIEIQRELVP